jgi:hypothetical protein
MDDATRTVVERYQLKIAPLEAEVNKYKRLVNELFKDCNEEPPYNIGDDSATSVQITTTRPDQYYGRPLATVVKDILDGRAKRNLGAISLNELFEGMKAGGYHFEKDETNAKISLSVTIAKNPAFTKLPNTGYIGLAAWYPEIKKRKATNGGAKTPETEDLHLAPAETATEATPSDETPAESEKPQNL